jgi:hypothetical protein
MAFDPNKPMDGALVDAAELRAQFIALKTLSDNLAAQVATLAASQTPIGGVVHWHRDKPGVPSLPANFVECNGQVLDMPDSPLHGQTIDDYNNSGRFPRGGTSSGAMGGSDSFGTASADNAGVGSPFAAVTTDFSPGASPIPPFITALWVMRVK